jgi:hypothetical protein
MIYRELAIVEETYVCDPQAVENTTEGGQTKEYDLSMEADLGEEDERIVEQMEADDAEHFAFMDEFAGRRFDDETDIPEDWVHIAPDAMTVDDGHHSSWEYSRIEVRQGQMFHDKVHLQHAIRRWLFLKRGSLWSSFLTPRRGTLSVSPQIVLGMFMFICHVPQIVLGVFFHVFGRVFPKCKKIES